MRPRLTSWPPQSGRPGRWATTSPPGSVNPFMLNIYPSVPAYGINCNVLVFVSSFSNDDLVIQYSRKKREPFFIFQVLDIDGLDLAMGKMMDQGPVLVITFNSQQILCVKDASNKVIEGSEDKVSQAKTQNFKLLKKQQNGGVLLLFFEISTLFLRSKSTLF